MGHASTENYENLSNMIRNNVYTYPTLFDLGTSQTYSKFIKSSVFLLKVATLRIFPGMVLISRHPRKLWGLPDYTKVMALILVVNPRL